MDPEPAAPKNNNKKLLMILFLLLLVLLAALAWWFFWSQKPESEEKQPAKKTATNSAETATKSTAQVDVLSDDELIKKALVAKTGISPETIAVTVGQKIDTFVKGSVGTKGEDTGGGYFLAVKVDGNWIIVYDGQATPDCTAVNPYNFPVSLVPECLNASGSLVIR